jgi:glycerate dehydrogenase
MKPMKIVVLDGHTENPGDLSWEAMGRLGSLTVYERTPPEKRAERIGDAEAVIVNKCLVDRELLAACPGLRYVGVLATGYNVVDTAAAREGGVVVTNIPAYGTDAVAQMAIALLLELCHHVGAHSAAVHSGRWASSVDWCFWDYPLIELAGKTMGIIGLGRIGRRTAAIASALGMKVIASDAEESEAGRAVAAYVPIDMLYRDADVITLHCPLFPATEKLINAASIARMKDGVLIINNARGQLIDEDDLAAALNSGKVAGAALDVLSTEPVRSNNPLLTAKNCIITPHISWASKESRQRLMDIAVENLRCFIAGHPQNVVSGGG